MKNKKIFRLTLLLIIGFLSLSIQAQTWELVHHEDFGTGYSGQPLPNNAAKSGFNNNDYGSSGAGNDRCMTSLLLNNGVYLTLEFTLSDTYEYYVSFNVKTDDPVGAEFALYHNTSVGASGTTIDNAINVPYIVAGQPWQEFSSPTITGLNGDHHFIITKGVNDPSTGNEWNRVDDFKLYRRLVSSGNNPPTISLTQPTDGATFDENESISLAATASDTDGTIQSVKFYHGTTLISEDTTTPFEATISGGLTAGSYTLKAVATDDDGATAEAQLSITVEAPSAPPSVTIDTPVDGALFEEGMAIAIQATASDTDGTIQSVQFYHGTTLISEDTTTPFEATISGGLTAGNYTLKAIATDDDGDTAEAQLSITVEAPNAPPSVTIDTPVDGALFEEGVAIAIQATASDTDGTIQSVQFYHGTTLINEDTTTPFEATISGGLTAGNYTLKAIATDDDGDTSENQIAITVNQTTGGGVDSSDWELIYEENFGTGYTGQPLPANWFENIFNGTTEGATGASNDPCRTSLLRFYSAYLAYQMNLSDTYEYYASMNLKTDDPAGAELIFYHNTIADASGTAIGSPVSVPFIPSTQPGQVMSSAIFGNLDGIHYFIIAKGPNDPSSGDEKTRIDDFKLYRRPIGGNIAPVISLTQPIDTATFEENESILMAATASDSDGTIQSVQFYHGTTLISEDTTAPFEATISGGLAAGSYTLKAIATDDDGDTSEDQISITVNQASGGNGDPVAVCSSIAAGSDDVEERSDGDMKRGQNTLEIINDGGNGDQTLGLRFLNLNIPQGATITNAYIQFTAASNDNQDPCQLNIYGEATDDAAGFLNQDFNLTSRSLTTASVAWSPITWTSSGQAGNDQQTTDISTVIQEIVNRTGYTENSAIALIINGSGRREAVAYNDDPNQAAELCVTYSLGCTDVDDDGICADEDCEDNNATVFPDAPEICDGIDNDCDGEIDEDIKIVGLTATVQDACEGQSNGSILLSIPSDSITYTFAWDNDSTNTQLDSLIAGEYCVTITTSQGCTVNKCYTVGTKICKEMTVTPMNVLTQSDGSAIRIRWAINDYDIWRLANTQGYTIRRTVYTRDTVQLSLTEQLQTSVVLTDQLLPLAPGSWTGQFPGDDRGTAAEQILYSNEWDIEVTGSPTFADAVQTQQMNENRLFFALFMADQDFALAQAMALGFEDNTAVAGEQYVYTVIINNTSGDNGRLAGSSFGDLENQGEELIAPTELSAEGKDKKIVIGWSMDFIDQQYTSFDIFRSEDGQNFTQANEAPFVFGADDQADARNAFYADSLGTNGTYYYQIVGRTPFGLTGPPSETIEGTARPPRLDVQLFIDSLQVDTAYAWLGWEALDIAYNDSLTEFNVYRALHINDPYELVTSTPLAITERHYQDDAALSESYYILEATDAHGHIYQSPPKFVQLPDLTPPAIPQGISGLDEEGIVTLNWQANTEPDLKGYRIYRSFVPDGEFILVSEGTINANTFSDDISSSILTDTVYYQVQSSDIRSNYSEVSPAVAILRTDITPPALPVLFKAMPTPAGVALGWRYSSSEDVVYHELQRKPKGTPDWEAILTISNEEQDQYVIADTTQITATCYLDESDLERREYEYQFIAYDDSGLSAGSEIIVLRPYDTGQRGSIEDFQIQNDCDWINGNSSIDLALKDKMEQVITEYEAINTIDVALRNSTIMGLEMAGVIQNTEMATWQAYTDLQFYNEINTLHTDYLAGATERLCKLKLDWSYAMEANIGGFEIHRSRDGSRMRLYKTLPIEFFFESGTPTSGTHSFAYSDEDSDSGIRYVYKIMAVYRDGGYSELSRPLTLVVE